MLLNSKGFDAGQPAPDFNLATPDGTRYCRDQIKGPKGMLVAFICNHCPYVIALIDRLASDMQALADSGIGCVAIMSNDYKSYPADTPDQMVKFAKAHSLRVPYLVDEDQSVAKDYGAVCTPDFFGFDAVGGLQYRGRLDNIGMRGDPAGREPELLNAMHQIASTGKAPENQTPSMGCSIKWR
ncbi:Redoxin [Sulfitobacter noctilucicola]|uniref:Peroxiredoxin n=1 Tax=Sulfitobacter noctilucicola TaxID=1342301 RepID=A0A7W6M6B5_9RHOB|nr:thioredoxin family protein [Sulfitobacter noctilucicola]KIN62986.1 Redoxin [Sulfitobacter noctilucicola]MBB4172487.1 peroxiredoxin [Sulfitobacter noctilucicola]